MTIEEAIEHCKEVAKESREAALSYARENAYETAISCKACGHEHEQLAEWLTELKQRRETEITAPPKSNADRIRQMTDEELSEMLLLSTCYFGCNKCKYHGKCKGKSCTEAAMEWLEQECEENDET